MTEILMNKAAYFISDVHLGLQSKELEAAKEKKLVRLLDHISADASELFIVGDLFDYWFEYRLVYQKGYFKTLAALAKLHEEFGVKIHYIIGNHDFMHRDFFEKQIGALLYEDGFHTELDGKKFYIAHGDGLVANDLGYKILKMVLRNKFIQWLYSFVHPDLGIMIASRSSKTSREYTKQKDYGEQDSMFAVAAGYIDQGSDYVVFGHSHKRDIKEYKAGRYINLGSWLQQPCYGVFRNQTFNIVDWN